MTSLSRHELELLDCNCNNCLYMVRNLSEYTESLRRHFDWQLGYYQALKRKKLERAAEWNTKGEQEKAAVLIDEVLDMKFQFNRNEALINYGHCEKFNKSVSFIPNTLQLQTQQCFKHRRTLS